MDSAPENFDMIKFEKKLESIRYVSEIHDLHVWTMAFGKPNMTVHITCNEHPAYVLKKATLICRKAGIYHSTI